MPRSTARSSSAVGGLSFWTIACCCLRHSLSLRRSSASRRLSKLRASEDLAPLVSESFEACERGEDDGKGDLRATADPVVRAGAGDGRLELLERCALGAAVLERTRRTMIERAKSELLPRLADGLEL